MATLEITLPEPLKAFIDLQVANGDYKDASEYLVTLIRDAEANERRIEALLLEAINSNEPPIRVTPEFWEERRRRLQSALALRRQSDEQ